MPESRLFTSSLTRRELARRRPGRHLWRLVLLGVMVVAIVLVAFLIGHGGA
jgi:hypothetical protein